ncbi:MAG TPA: ATP-binding protein [Pyrinomonadaceae bacterium]|nr:ATP-binding protein [Pyrinomonadaceae bacterium]
MAASTEAPATDSQPEFTPALQTIVELVRRIMNADVASILGFSLIDETVKWKAASGFTVDVDYTQPVFRPLGSTIARRAFEENTVGILEGIGTHTAFPTDDFPVHVAEGVCDMAIAPLRIIGNNSGALTAGYRVPHQFSEEEKQLLKDLAEMAAVVMDSERLVESITAAEKIWEQTFNAIGEGILVHDSAGAILHCNARAAEMLETDQAAVIGLQFREAFARMFGRRAADYYLADNQGASTVVEVQSEYGRRFLVSIFPIQKPDGQSVNVVTWNDVTRLSEMQDQLGRSQRLATVGQLAAGVAHEVNNPLAAITTCAEAIMRDMRQEAIGKHIPETADWNYYLEEIVRQALRCKEITRGLLDLTRQRQAKLALCDLSAIAKQCARAALQRATTNAEFEINIDETIGEVATDAAMVNQILDNLLSNAIDAIGDKKGKVIVSTRREGARAVIEVEDTGQGIPADLLAKIFDPFFSTKGPGKGYGLGLAISATLAESLRGGLNIESKPGQGSKFRLWIPRRPLE